MPGIQNFLVNSNLRFSERDLFAITNLEDLIDDARQIAKLEKDEPSEELVMKHLFTIIAKTQASFYKFMLELILTVCGENTVDLEKHQRIKLDSFLRNDDGSLTTMKSGYVDESINKYIGVSLGSDYFGVFKYEGRVVVNPYNVYLYAKGMEKTLLQIIKDELLKSYGILIKENISRPTDVIFMIPENINILISLADETKFGKWAIHNSFVDISPEDYPFIHHEF